MGNAPTPTTSPSMASAPTSPLLPHWLQGRQVPVHYRDWLRLEELITSFLSTPWRNSKSSPQVMHLNLVALRVLKCQSSLDLAPTTFMDRSLNTSAMTRLMPTIGLPTVGVCPSLLCVKTTLVLF